MIKKISILLVNPSAKIGGGNTISNSLAAGLNKDIFKVFSFFPEEGPAISVLKKAEGIKILMPLKPHFYSVLIFLYGFLRKNKISIVHAHGTRAAFWVKLVLCFLRKRPKFIYTVHGLHIIYRPLIQKYLLLYLERALNVLVDKLVCPSLSVKSSVEQYKIIKKTKIELIYNGIDIKKFAQALPLDKKFLNIPGNYLIISAIQRLNFPKDLSTILQAFKEAKKIFRNIILLIVGSGLLEEKLKSEAEKLKITSSVLFLGDRQDIPNILAISDIVILSSAFEALGLSLLEAMAAKKPVIGSNVDGIREIIQDSKNGFLFEFGNYAQLTQKLKTLISDKRARILMGVKGYELVKSKFDLKIMLTKYARIYMSLIK